MSRLLLWAITLALVAYAALFAQPEPEGAMGTFPVPQVVKMTGSDAVEFTARIEVHDTYDPSGVRFFALVFPNATRAVVSVDADLELAEALQRLNKRKVRLVLDPLELERLSR